MPTARRAAAILASVTAPGAGLFVLGRWRLGAAWVVASLLCLPLGVALFRVYPPLLLLGLLPGPFIWLGALVDTVVANPGRNPPGIAVASGVWFAFLIGTRLPSELVRAFVAEPFKIPSGAMQPTLEVGDHVFVDKLAYRVTSPARGDLVVFEIPEDRRKSYLKRIAGLPGDTIEIRDGILQINGAAQPQDGGNPVTLGDADCQATEATRYDETLDGVEHGILQMRTPAWSGGPWTVPAGEFFVLGDNRDNSLDSSRAGFTVPFDHIDGHVSFVWLSWDHCARRVRTERLGLVVR